MFCHSGIYIEAAGRPFNYLNDEKIVNANRQADLDTDYDAVQVKIDEVTLRKSTARDFGAAQIANKMARRLEVVENLNEIFW